MVVVVVVVGTTMSAVIMRGEWTRKARKEGRGWESEEVAQGDH